MNLGSVDLNRLLIFKEVVLAGSFSKAAEKLRIPKSRISRNITFLESEMGVQLIYRTTRQFQLTQIGAELFQKAIPLLAELEHVLEEAATDFGEVSGMLRVTVPEDVGSELMGKICAEFLGLHPKVQIGLHASNQVVDLVKDSIDIAIRIGKVKDSTMIQKVIGSLETGFFASADFLRRYPELTRVDALEDLPFLAFSSPGQKVHTLKVWRGKDLKSLRLHSSISSNNFFALRSMAQEGLGFTWMPLFVARKSISKGLLVPIFKDWHFDATPVTILRPHQKEVPERVRKFIDFLTVRLQQRL